ncbi:MAG: nuclear transport factor 2 family protein [Cytophagales bacterium]|nr:MAG: nuclear transport factor 2 family protein [Cytophagales bacterium]
MTRLLLTLIFLASFFAVKAQSADEQAVLAAEKARFEATVAKNYDAMNELLADDLVYTHSSGVVDTKQAYIQSIKDGKAQYNSIDIKEQKARVYGKTAIINGIVYAKMGSTDGKVTELKLRYTDAYVKKKGRWQLVAWQSLRLAQ